MIILEKFNIEEDKLAICLKDVEGLKTKYHIGFVKKDGMEFINRFSDRLHDMNGAIENKNGWLMPFYDKNLLKPFDNNIDKNTMPLIYSDKFRDIIGYSLSFLIDYEHIYHCDISYIDVTWKNDTISFLSSRDFHKLKNGETPWDSSIRQESTIGRFINRFIDEKDKSLENYVNEYKFAFKLFSENLGEFRIAKGIEMAPLYLEKKYAEGGGNLKSSCMRHPKSQMRLPIYINNSDKVKMLYLLNEEGKLLGRVLIWKLDEPRGKFYMDRIYVAEDYLEKLFLDYANKKNFLTKGEVEGNNITLKVKLDEDYGRPQINPFMDTFKFFNRKEYYLTNKFDNLKVGEYWEYIDHD